MGDSRNIHHECLLAKSFSELVEEQNGGSFRIMTFFFFLSLYASPPENFK